jgi:hypothetical protein
MRIDPAQKLFFGFKVDSKLRDALSMASATDKQYFAEGSQYLCVLSNGAEHWIGKMVEAPITPGEVEDIQRNVVSILNRIAAAVRHSVSNMRIFSVGEGESTPLPVRVRQNAEASDDEQA